eukprot:scaffold332_cov308-Pavlova_lutheri.AAC.1
MAGKTSPSSRDWNVDGKRDHAIVRCGQSTISDASGYVRGVPSDAYRGCFGPCGHLIDRQRFLEGESIASFLSFDGDVEIAGFVDLEESCVDGFAIVEDVHGGGQGRSRGQDHHGRRRRESQRLRIVDLPRQLLPLPFPSRPVASRSTPSVFVSPFRHQRSLHGPGPVRARFRSSCSAACPWSPARVRRRRWRWRRVRPCRRRSAALRFRSSRAPTSSRFRLDSKDPILPEEEERIGVDQDRSFSPLPTPPLPLALEWEGIRDRRDKERGGGILPSFPPSPDRWRSGRWERETGGLLQIGSTRILVQLISGDDVPLFSRARGLLIPDQLEWCNRDVLCGTCRNFDCSRTGGKVGWVGTTVGPCADGDDACSCDGRSNRCVRFCETTSSDVLDTVLLTVGSRADRVRQEWAVSTASLCRRMLPATARNIRPHRKASAWKGARSVPQTSANRRGMRTKPVLCLPQVLQAVVHGLDDHF